jgi:hypothetical protein
MRKYRVSGNREVLGHLPGEEFTADIPDVQEQRLVKGGHIEPVSRPKRQPTVDQPDDRAGEPDQDKE